MVMFLNSEQIQKLKTIFATAGLNNSDFNSNNEDREYSYYRINDPNSFRFQIRQSIQGALFADVFCEPYTYAPHIYKSCDNFDECLRLAYEWATVTSYKLAGKTYYHKIFISHSSEDKHIIDEFVDKILRLSCGFNTSDIIYTSRQSTGVNLGDGIPQFIKSNLETASLVLFMISPNYRRSEVCLNEMGAAWALDKKIVSILLPNVSFDNLGWLTSLDKAIKIDDSEGLDKLASMLCRKELDISDWNRQKGAFIFSCKKRRKSKYRTNIQTPQYKLGNKGDLVIFDTDFYVRAVTEGEYQYQLNMRVRASSDITLKDAFIVNDNTFIGDSSKPCNQLKLASFIPMDCININTIDISEYKNVVISKISEDGIQVIDKNIKKGEQISISFVGAFITTRECDGNVDLPLNNWSFHLSYNIDGYINIPIKLEIAKGNINGYFWHN